MTNFATICKNEHFFRRAATYGLTLISPLILTIKNFLDFNEARLFKIFPLRECFLGNFFYLQELQVGAQLMTDTIYKTRGPTRLNYGFRVKPLIFMDLTKYFGNFFCIS